LVAKWDKSNADERHENTAAEGDALRGTDAALTPNVYNVYGEDANKADNAADKHKQAKMSFCEREVVREHRHTVQPICRKDVQDYSRRSATRAGVFA
jgi:hypothetical protein